MRCASYNLFFSKPAFFSCSDHKTRWTKNLIPYENRGLIIEELKNRWNKEPRQKVIKDLKEKYNISKPTIYVIAKSVFHNQYNIQPEKKKDFKAILELLK